MDHAQAPTPSAYHTSSSRTSSTLMRWLAALRRIHSSLRKATILATGCTPTSSTVGKTAHCLIFSLPARSQSSGTKTSAPARTSSRVVPQAAVACPCSTRRMSTNLANFYLAAIPSPTPTQRRRWLSHLWVIQRTPVARVVAVAAVRPAALRQRAATHPHQPTRRLLEGAPHPLVVLLASRHCLQAQLPRMALNLQPDLQAQRAHLQAQLLRLALMLLVRRQCIQRSRLPRRRTHPLRQHRMALVANTHIGITRMGTLSRRGHGLAAGRR